MDSDKQNGGRSIKKVLAAAAAITVLAVLFFKLPILAIFIAITSAVSIVLGFFVMGFLEKQEQKEAAEKYIEDKTEEFETKKEEPQSEFDIEDFPVPYAVIYKEGTVKKSNRLFKELFTGQNIHSMRSIFTNFSLENEEEKYSFGGKVYSVKRSEEDKNGAFPITITDITESERLKMNLENQLVSAGYIYIDNYEEVFGDVDSSVIPILTAMIDDKLNTHIAKIGGAVKKFEKDRYIFMINKNSLDDEIENRFEILNEIRETKVAEHMPVTLSIGVGTSTKNMADAMHNAKEAIDLAMGRGGDQAVIKNKNGYQFFGGKSSEVSHNARVRARVKAEALKNLMIEADRIFITGHKRPDFDSLGSSIGLYSIANSLGKECHIILGPLTAAVKNVYEKFANNPEYENMFISERDALKLMSDKSMLAIADTHIKSMVECDRLLPLFNKIVLFDHHRKSTEFIDNAVLIYHEPYASSTSELISEMIRHFGNEVKLKPIEADALLAGIVVDTKNFGIKAGAVTFEAAAFLRRNGADSTRVRYLFKNDLELFKLKAEAIKRAEIYKSGIIISVCDSYGENSNILAAQTADDLLNVTGIRASVVLCCNDKKIFVSARSYGDVNVQLLLEKIGGGGHLTMAGAQMDETDIEAAMNKIKEAVDRYIEEEE